MKKVFATIALLVLVVSAVVVLQAMSFLSSRPSDSSEVALFEVQPRQSFKAIAAELEAKNLVTSARKLEILARLTGAPKKIRVGEYAIRKDSTPREVLKMITSGKSIEYVVTIQEGLNKFEIAALLERQGLASKKEFLDLCANPAFIEELLDESLPSLEGYLFPETYHLTKFTGAKGLIRMMVARFLENYATVRRNPEVNLTRHQVVTLASIVEKETGAVDERTLVSSVFHNRLRLKMKLQTDPTVVYGILDANREYSGNIRRSDLLTPSRYNTYAMTGLPFGPISNPGRDALDAAVHPAKTEFLFFVSRNDGTHIYSKEYSQHAKAVTQFQMNAKAREGKSWRDLSKAQAAAAAAARAKAAKPKE